MSAAFRLEHADTSDPNGESDIGRFTMHNVSEALSQLWRFWRLLARTRPACVYISIARGLWGFLRDAMLILPARLAGAKVVVHLRAGRFDLIHDCGPVGRLLARVTFPSVSKALVLGESVRDVFGRYVPADRVEVVPNGMNLEEWPRPEENRSRAVALRIVYLANLFHDKGAHVMLRALPEVLASAPGTTVTFAGGWHDDAYRRHCEELVSRGGLADSVCFAGVVRGEEKRALLTGADVVVFVPVAPEGSPWVVLEAMACARPVIGTPQGTMRETIVDGRTGYLVPVDDERALAERLSMLAHDPELRASLGRCGRERVEELYSEAAAHARLAGALLDTLR